MLLMIRLRKLEILSLANLDFVLIRDFATEGRKLAVSEDIS